MHANLAARLRLLPAIARRALSSRRALLEWRASLEGLRTPDQVGGALIDRLRSWLPLDQWVLVAVTDAHEMQVVAHSGRRLRGQGAIFSLAEAVIARDQDAGVASLRTLGRRAPDVAAIAWRLRGRQGTVGVLVACDDQAAEAPPEIAAVADTLAAEVLGPAGLAFEVALRLDRLARWAAIDDLTGLYNAGYLHQAIDREIQRMARTTRPVSLLFLDLDAFKRVNDQHGHLMGSRALVEFGGVLRASTRATDTVGRYGGDEFVVVLPETDRQQARLVARRIQQRVSEAEFLREAGLQVRLTVSVGIATLTRPTWSAADLIGRADQAMYWVKRHGRNGIRAFRLAPAAPRGSRTT